MLNHSKIRKMPFWMIQIPKNEVFGHFLELGASDWLQIAYYNYTKWSLTSGLSYRPCWIIQNSQKMPFWMIQIAKKEVFGHLLAFGALDWLDIAYFDRTKWHARFRRHTNHAGSFKNEKNAFLNDPSSQKWDFWPFSWVWWLRLTRWCIFW